MCMRQTNSLARLWAKGTKGFFTNLSFLDGKMSEYSVCWQLTCSKIANSLVTLQTSLKIKPFTRKRDSEDYQFLASFDTSWLWTNFYLIWTLNNFLSNSLNFLVQSSWFLSSTEWKDRLSNILIWTLCSF